MSKSKPKARTILGAPQSKIPVLTKAPVIKEKPKNNKKERVLEAIFELYPRVPGTYPEKLMEVEWLAPSSMNFTSNMQEVLDSLEQSGPREIDYNNLNAVLSSIEFEPVNLELQKDLESIASSRALQIDIEADTSLLKKVFRSVLKILNSKSSKYSRKLLKNLRVVLEDIQQAYLNQEAMYEAILAAESFYDIRSNLPQFEAAEVAHAFYVKSLLIRPKGILGTVACAKCGCYEYYRESIHTSGMDEPTKILRICAGC